MRKAIQALLVELRVGYRTAFLADARLAKPRVGFEKPVIVLAFAHIPLRRPIRRNVAGICLWSIGYGLRPAGAGRRRRRILGLRSVISGC